MLRIHKLMFFALTVVVIAVVGFFDAMLYVGVFLVAACFQVLRREFAGVNSFFFLALSLQKILVAIVLVNICKY